MDSAKGHPNSGVYGVFLLPFAYDGGYSHGFGSPLGGLGYSRGSGGLLGGPENLLKVPKCQTGFSPNDVSIDLLGSYPVGHGTTLATGTGRGGVGFWVGLVPDTL